MLATKTHEAAKNSSDAATKALKSGPRDSKPQPQVNPVWQRLATHVAGPAASAAALPGVPVIQLKPT